MTTITHAQVTVVLEDLERQHAQTLANLNAIDGARQLARKLLKQMEEGGADSTLQKPACAKASQPEASPGGDDGTAG